MAKNVWVKIEKLVWHFLPESAGIFFFMKRQEISPQTKNSKTTLLSRAAQWVKLPIFTKKCIFWPENDIFSKKIFYSKLISDENYMICTCQKIHFQNKIMRLQFSPDSTYPWPCFQQNSSARANVCLFFVMFSGWQLNNRTESFLFSLQ